MFFPATGIRSNAYSTVPQRVVFLRLGMAVGHHIGATDRQGLQLDQNFTVRRLRDWDLGKFQSPRSGYLDRFHEILVSVSNRRFRPA